MSTVNVYLVLEGPEIASPGMSVAIIVPLLPKVPGNVAIDNGLAQNDALMCENQCTMVYI